MIYDYLGNDKYRIVLKIYRDCFNGQAPFDGLSLANGPVIPANITVREANGAVVGVYNIGTPIITVIPPTINSPCVTPPNNVCVEEGVYTYTLTLPPKTGGYYIIYQRCCRNTTVLNLLQSGEQGSTYFTKIPGPEDAVNNSSPRFSKFPAIFLCENYAFNFDHSAVDPDGDQLVYSFFSPFQGVDGCCTYIGNPSLPSVSQFCAIPPSNCPQEAPAPNYPIVSFIAPYSGSYPIASNPSLSIGLLTGKLTGKPILQGQFVVGICVDEYRNGKLLNRHYRDFQFNIVNCLGVLGGFDNEVKCRGNTFSFNNQSFGGTNFHWDFGVPGTNVDTSNLVNPNFTYPDTGKYTVTLIAGSNSSLCKDTVKKTVLVFPALDINFPKSSKQCLSLNSFNFNVTGSYIASTTFNWDFSSAASPSTSTLLNPKNITFSQPGKFFVKLTAKHFACIDSFIDTIRILNEPIAKIGDLPTICVGAPLKFKNLAVSEGLMTSSWNFGDNTSSTEFEPTHSYRTSGIFRIDLKVITEGICSDTVTKNIWISPLPHAGFIVTPKITTILDPEINIKNTASGDAMTFRYTFGDGAFSPFPDTKHIYTSDGSYLITQFVTNGFGCTDSTTEVVNLQPEFRFWIPNAFTPDGNSLNDMFMPVTFGATKYLFEVFDRWGQKLFSTNNTNQGWNGTYRGKECQQDIYVWKISYKNPVLQSVETRYGHFTLLKNP